MITSSFSPAQILTTSRGQTEAQRTDLKEPASCISPKTYGWKDWTISLAFTAVQAAFFLGKGVEGWMGKNRIQLGPRLGPKLFTQQHWKAVPFNILLCFGVEFYRQSHHPQDPFYKIHLKPLEEYNPLPASAFAFATFAQASLIKTMNNGSCFRRLIGRSQGLLPGKVFELGIFRGFWDCYKLGALTSLTAPAILTFYGISIAIEKHRDGKDWVSPVIDGLIAVYWTTFMSVLLMGGMRWAPALQYSKPDRSWYYGINHLLLFVQQSLGVSYLTQLLTPGIKASLGCLPEKKVAVCDKMKS